MTIAKLTRKMKILASLAVLPFLVLAFQNCGNSVQYINSSVAPGGDGHEGKPTLLIDSEAPYDPNATLPSNTYYEVSQAPVCRVDQTDYSNFIGTLVVQTNERRLYCSSESDVRNSQPPSGPYANLGSSQLGFAAYQPGYVTQDGRLYARDRATVSNTALYCRSQSAVGAGSSSTGVDLKITNHAGNTEVPLARYLLEGATSLPAGATFTRSSTATFINMSGNLETAASNQPRWYRDPTTSQVEGLLLESETTNHVLQSNTFALNPWNTQNSSIASLGGVNPMGQAGHSALVESNQSGWHYVSQLVALDANQNYVFSTYVKDLGQARDISVRSENREGVPARCTFRFQSETFMRNQVSDQVLKACHFEKLAGGWYRIAIIFFSGAGGSPNTPKVKVELWDPQRGGDYLGNGAASVAIWGAQLEKSSAPTSYIPTTNASAVRAADRLDLPAPTVAGGDLSLFVRSRARSSTPNLESNFLRFSGMSSGTSRFSVSATTHGRMTLEDSGGVVLASAAANTALSKLHQALAIGGSSVSAYQNGDPSGVAQRGVQTDLTTFQLSSSGSSVNHAIVSEFAVYESAFTHADLAYLSSLEVKPLLQMGALILGTEGTTSVANYKRLTTVPVVLNETASNGFSTDAFDFQIERLNDTGSYKLSAKIQGGLSLQETLQCYTIRGQN